MARTAPFSRAAKATKRRASYRCRSFFSCSMCLSLRALPLPFSSWTIPDRIDFCCSEIAHCNLILAVKRNNPRTHDLEYEGCIYEKRAESGPACKCIETAIRTNRGGETTEKFLLFPSGTERRAIADERAIKSFFFPLGLALREREKAGIARAGL